MRVALVGFGSRGDVQPFVALAAGLADAGHEVILAAPRRFAPLTHGAGITFLGCDDAFLDLQDELVGAGALTAITESRRLAPAMRHWLDDLAAVADQPTDVIVYHPKSLGAAHIADRLGVPALPVQLIPIYEVTAAFPSPLVPQWWPAAANRLSWRVASAIEAPWRRLLSRWRSERLGLSGPMATTAQRIRSGEVLNAWSPAVLPAPPEWPHTSEPVGFLTVRTPATWMPPTELSDFLAAGEAPVYVGFGSMKSRDPAAITSAAVDALRLAGRRGILVTGSGGLDASGACDDILVLDSIPHDWLLPRVAVAVHHGGVGTFAAAAQTGVPQVIRPFFGDQPFWARRAAELGVAPRPIRRANPDTLAVAIADAARRADSARKLGEQLRAEDGVAAAIRRIEALARQ